MGVYLYGSEGFFTRAPSGYGGGSIDGLVDLLGVGSAETRFGVMAQSILFEDFVTRHPEREIFEGCSGLLVVAEHPIHMETWDCGDVEEWIYAVCDSWRDAIDGLMVTPNFPSYADLLVENTYTFERAQWSAIIDVLAAEVPEGEREGIIARKDAVHERRGDLLPVVTAIRDAVHSRWGTSLSLLAANALLHAIEHDLDVMTITDPREGMSTNLFDCMQDSIWMEDMDKGSLTFEDRVRLIYFGMMKKSTSWRDEANALLEERYDDKLATSVAMKMMDDEHYTQVIEFGESLITRYGLPVKDSLGIRKLVGDAYLQLLDEETHLKLGRDTQAQRIASELAEAGDATLDAAVSHAFSMAIDHAMKDE